jgi:hypothetical protein
MTTTKMKALHTYVPILRVNEEKREVEAYAFVNEKVQGEGGIRLKRTSMEAATADYMKWANVREMHRGDSAVAVAQQVKWDATGAHMTLRVSDDAAWQKVKDGVYKGLSVGVIPEVMRGKDVEKCTWMETSLVDRPADPDARITVFRADGYDPEAEHDVQILDDHTPFLTAGEAFAEEFSLIRASAVGNKEKLARKALRRLSRSLAPLLDTGEPSKLPGSIKEPKPMSEKKDTPPPVAAVANEGEAVTLLARMDAFETAQTARIERMEKAFADSSEASAKLLRKAEKKTEKANAKLERMGKQPAAVPAIARFPGAPGLVRNLNAGNPYGDQSNAPDGAKLLADYNALVEKGMTEQNPDRRNDIVDQIQAMKPILASVGVEV